MSTVTSTGRVSRVSLAGHPADALRGLARVREIYGRFAYRYRVPVAAVLTITALVKRAHLSGEARS